MVVAVAMAAAVVATAAVVVMVAAAAASVAVVLALSNMKSMWPQYKPSPVIPKDALLGVSAHQSDSNKMIVRKKVVAVVCSVDRVDAAIRSDAS